MYICMYICVCVYMCVYIYIYIYIYSVANPCYCRISLNYAAVTVRKFRPKSKFDMNIRRLTDK